MDSYNELWSEFCRSGSIISYLSYKQTMAALNSLNEFEQDMRKDF